MTDDNELRKECFKALHCLSIAVEKEIADDITAKVTEYIEALEIARWKFRESQAFLRKLVAMVVMQEGGTLTVGPQAQGDASLNSDPIILTHTDPETLSIRVTVLKPGKPT